MEQLMSGNTNMFGFPQVGQLLLYLRVSSNNRMLPFCSQLIDLCTDFSAPRTPTTASSHSQGQCPGKN